MRTMTEAWMPVPWQGRDGVMWAPVPEALGVCGSWEEWVEGKSPMPSFSGKCQAESRARWLGKGIWGQKIWKVFWEEPEKAALGQSSTAGPALVKNPSPVREQPPHLTSGPTSLLLMGLPYGIPLSLEMHRFPTLFFFFFYSHTCSMWKFLGLESNQSCSCPTPQPQQCGIWVTSATYTTAHSNTGSLIHLASSEIKPMFSWILVGFFTAEPQWELLDVIFCIPIPTSNEWEFLLFCIFSSIWDCQCSGFWPS